MAREAEMCYATMAMVTDYDVWYEGEEDVTLEKVLANVARNVETAQSHRAPRGRRARPGARLRLPPRRGVRHQHAGAS